MYRRDRVWRNVSFCCLLHITRHDCIAEALMSLIQCLLACLLVYSSCSHAGCSCPEYYTGVHCELTKSFKHRTQQPTDTKRFMVLLFTFIVLVVAVVLIAVARVVMYRMPGRLERDKLFIKNSHMGEEPYRGTMEEVGFIDQTELEDVVL